MRTRSTGLMTCVVLAAATCVGGWAGPARAGDSPPRVQFVNPSGWVTDQQGVEIIAVSFTEEVVIPRGAIVVRNQAGVIDGVTAEYDSDFDVLILTLPQPVQAERLTLVIDHTIFDVDGILLDGEIANPLAPVFPSGNGSAGGKTVVRMNVLQGDATRDGVVDQADAQLIANTLGQCLGDPGFVTGADLNKDGCVNVLDVNILQGGFGLSMPLTDGVAPTVTGFDPPPDTPLAAPLAGITATFSEPIDADVFTMNSCYVVGGSGAAHIATFAQLALDGLSAEYLFQQPIDQCQLLTARLTNDLADASGATLDSTTLEAELTGLLPVGIPLLDAVESPTNSTTLRMSGTAEGAAYVRITTPAGVFDAPVNGDAFAATVDLEPDRVNQIFVSSIGLCDQASAPATAFVTVDTEAPEVLIQFPLDGSETTDETVDVSGTVGDALSGFMGLTVTVNGVEAIVNVGIGTNGTFLAEGVPLGPAGDSTGLEAVASDELGNTAMTEVTITRLEIPDGAPQIMATGGAGQTGTIRTELAEPITVQVLKGDGSPFAGKVVTFDVDLSDGTLSEAPAGAPTRVLQLLTDGSGFATCFWTLGSDAGCGNNRVIATSTDIVAAPIFSASALAAPADRIHIGSGNDQRAETGSTAPQPLRVWVSDGNNPANGVPVTFTVTEGGGLVAGAVETTVLTDAAGHANVDFALGADAMLNRIEAAFPENPGLPATFTIRGLHRDLNEPTTFVGRVLDNARRAVGGAPVELTVNDEPMPPTATDVDGRFELTGIADGPGHLHVDGLVATTLDGEPIPPGSFPALAYEVVVIPNAVNEIGMPVFLPPLDPANAVEFDNTTDVDLTVAGMDGLRMIVRAGSMTRRDGSVPSPADPAIVALNQVHFDEIPMPMPDGAAPPFAWTLQPAGAHFDPPVAIELPNMTGQAPGAATYFVSFDHDTNQFEIVAQGRITDDGALAVSNPGDGLIEAGWGGGVPPPPPMGDVTNCHQDDPRIAALIRQRDMKIAEAQAAWNSAVAKFPSPASLVADIGLCGLSVSGAVTTCVVFPPGCYLSLVLAFGTCALNVDTTADAILAIIAANEAKVAMNAANALQGEIWALCAAIDLSNEVEAAIHRLDEAIAELAAIAQAIIDLYNGYQDTREQIQYWINQLEDLIPPSGPAGGDIDELLELIAGGADAIGLITLGFEEQAAAFAQADLAAFSAAADVIGYDGWGAAVGNQATSVSSHGAFHVSNIPADGRLVRATLSGNGLFGASDYFTVEANTTVTISTPIATGPTFPPVPVALLPTAGATVLTPGEQTQLTVTGFMSDGTQQTLNTAVDGTTYFMSSGSIATVDSGGLVTAVANGTALITVTNEGVTAVKQIIVASDTTTTTVTGIVVDEQGDAVAGATVETTYGGTAETDANGAFLVDIVVPSDAETMSALATADVKGSAVAGTSGTVDIMLEAITDLGVIELAEVVYWIFDGNGNWNTPSNWSTGVLPGPDDDVLISRPRVDVTVSVTTNVGAVNGLLLAEGLGLSGSGVLAVNGQMTAMVPLSVGGGALNINGNATLLDFTLSAGTLGGSGVVTVNGLLTWGSTTGTTSFMSGAGETIANGGILLTGTSQQRLDDNRTLTNAGIATYEGGNFAGDIGSIFNNLEGATFDIQGDWDMTIGGTPTFNNDGLFVKSSGLGTSNIQRQFNNTGTVLVQSGILRLEMFGGSNTGTMHVARDSWLKFFNGTFTMSAPGTVTGPGTLHVSTNCTLSVIDDVTIDVGLCLIDGTSGTAAVTVDGSLTTDGDLTLARGTLQGSGTSTVTGLLTWGSTTGTTSYMAGTGETIANGGILLTGTSQQRLDDNRTLTNAGIATYEGGNFAGDIGSIFNNLENATFDIQGDWDMTIGGTPVFNNDGLFVKSSGGGTSNIQRQFNNTNTGTVLVESGILRLEMFGGSNTGTLHVARDSWLKLFNGTFTMSAPGTVTGPGTLHVSTNCMLSVIDDVTIDVGLCLIDGSSATATVTVDGSLATDGDLELSRGTLGGVGTTTVNGLLTWGNSGGTDASMSGSGETITNGGVLLTGNGQQRLETGRTLTNAGIAVYEGGNFVSQRAVFHNLAGAIFEIQGDLDMGHSGTPVFNNDGLFVKTSGVGTSEIRRQFNNTGTVLVQSGAVEIQHFGGSNSGIYDIAADAFLTLDGNPTFTMTAPGTATGPGMLIYKGSSTLSLVGDVVVDVGVFRIDGPSDPTVSVVDSLTTNGELQLLRGTLGGEGIVTVNGLLTWGNSGGTDASMSGSGETITNGGVLLTGNGQQRLETGRTLTNAGIAVYEGGNFVSQSAVFHNLAGATFEIQGDLDMGYSGTPVFNNDGLFVKSSGVGTSEIYRQFNNTGTVLAQSGTIHMQLSGASSSGTLRAEAAGTLALPTGFTFLAGSQVEIVVAGTRPGTEHGRLIVDGSPAFAGSLTLEYTAPRPPMLGDFYDVVLFDALGAPFDRVILPDPGGGLTLVESYEPTAEPTALRVTATEPAER